MPYAYAALWFAIGLILIFSMGKENKVFYFAGGFFLLLGAWWLADALLPEVDLFAGGWGIALKVITGCAWRCWRWSSSRSTGKSPGRPERKNSRTAPGRSNRRRQGNRGKGRTEWMPC